MDLIKAEENYINLVNEFVAITQRIGRSSDDAFDYRNFLNHLLNELSTCDYKSLKICNSKQTYSFISSIRKIPIAEDTFIVKACWLIVAIVNKQTIVLPVNILKSTVDWLLQFVCEHRNVGLCDVLRAIQVLIKGNVDGIPQISASLISPPNGLLVLLLTDPSLMNDKSLKYEGCLPNEIQLAAANCLETALTTAIDSFTAEHLADIMKIIINLIYSLRSEEFGQLNYCLLMTALLNIAKQICLAERDICSKYLGELLGAARAFMLYNLPDIALAAPTRVNVSQQAVAEQSYHQPNQIVKGGKVAKTRKPRTASNTKTNRKNVKNKIEPDNEMNYFANEAEILLVSETSESDYNSDSEGGRAQYDRQKYTKLRLVAISLLGVIGNAIDTRTLFGYWHSFFPAERMNNSTVALLNCAIKDPNQRCRMAAYQATAVLLYGSKTYLTQAEQSDKASASFIPFSITLGNMIIEMYTVLAQAIAMESSLPVLTQILKCLSVLVQATPFNRLKSGFLPQIIVYIKRLVHHRDTTIQVAALRVIGFLIANTEITAEISKCIGVDNEHLLKNQKRSPNQIHDYGGDELIETEIDETDPYDEIQDDTTVTDKLTNLNLTTDKCSESNDQMTWLLKVTLDNLGVTKQAISHPSIRIESIQLLATISQHFVLVKNHLQPISKALDNVFNDSNAEIRLFGGRCLDLLGHSMSAYLLDQKDLSSNQEDLNNCIEFWLKIIPIIIEQMQDPRNNVSLKAWCCDALSSIGVHVFERLTRERQIVLISLLSGSSFDEEPAIRAAAIRALAIYVLFPSLREDVIYIENTTEAVLRALHQGKTEVRVKGSWALANISDALIANSLDTKIDKISDDTLEKLFRVSITCKDNDKIRGNAVRILGNLLRLITIEHIKLPLWQELVWHSIKELHHNCTAVGNMKVKWNACYAIGNFIKNPAIFDDAMQKYQWPELIFNGLCDIIVTCPNFKVRINATIALKFPQELRPHLNKQFLLIWSALLKALEQSDRITDFNEYQHRDNLMEQLCLAIAHFIAMMRPDDIIEMHQILLNFDSTKVNWTRVINRIIPEKAAPLIAATVKLKEWDKANAIVGQEQKMALETMRTYFVPITECI